MLLLLYQTRQKTGNIVIFSRAVGPFQKAILAFVDQNVFSALKSDINRPHQSQALFRPITRVDIHVLAPQAVRAMIGIAIASH
jgi:hypothetical protein